MPQVKSTQILKYLTLAPWNLGVVIPVQLLLVSEESTLIPVQLLIVSEESTLIPVQLLIVSEESTLRDKVQNSEVCRILGAPKL